MAITLSAVVAARLIPIPRYDRYTSRESGRIEARLLMLLVALCMLSAILWTAQGDMPPTAYRPIGSSESRDLEELAANEDPAIAVAPDPARVSPEAAFMVIVRDTEGAPVADARVVVSEQIPTVQTYGARLESIGIQVRRLQAATAADGIAHLPIPGWAAKGTISNIVVRRSGFRPFAGQLAWDARRTEVTLDSGLEITGRAILYDGRPPRDARALLYAVGEDSLPVTMTAPDITDLDTEGLFTFTGLYDCEYEIVVMCAGHCTNPLQKRRFRPDGTPITICMLPVLGCRIQMLSQDGTPLVLPHGTTTRIDSPVQLDYTMNSALEALYDLTPEAKNLLDTGELVAGIAMNAMASEDFSDHMATLVLDAPTGCVATTKFPCLMTDLEEAVATPHFFRA